MLSSVEHAFVGRDEKRAPLKTPAWEANAQRDCVDSLCINLVWDGGIFVTAASAAGSHRINVYFLKLFS